MSDTTGHWWIHAECSRPYCQPRQRPHECCACGDSLRCASCLSRLTAWSALPERCGRCLQERPQVYGLALPGQDDATLARGRRWLNYWGQHYNVRRPDVATVMRLLAQEEGLIRKAGPLQGLARATKNWSPLHAKTLRDAAFFVSEFLRFHPSMEDWDVLVVCWARWTTAR